MAMNFLQESVQPQSAKRSLEKEVQAMLGYKELIA
jgi:hypothetical protein